MSKELTKQRLEQSFMESLDYQIDNLPEDADEKQMCWDICFSLFTKDGEEDILELRDKFVKEQNKFAKRFIKKYKSLK